MAAETHQRPERHHAHRRRRRGLGQPDDQEAEPAEGAAREAPEAVPRVKHVDVLRRRVGDGHHEDGVGIPPGDQKKRGRQEQQIRGHSIEGVA